MNWNPENGLVVKQNFKFISKSPVKDFQAPNNRTTMKRGVLFPEPVLYSFILISDSPQLLRTSPMK
jgi:hypothetical protein